MSRRKIFLTLCLSFVFSLLWSQTILGGLETMKIDSIEKKVFDRAKYIAFYRYTYTEGTGKKEATTMLKIGKRYNQFVDYYAVRSDSINDSFVGKKNAAREYSSLMTAAEDKIYFFNDIIYRLGAEMINQQEIVLSDRCQYQEKTPDIKWEILPEKKTISTYQCQGAKAKWGGRQYIAWYTKQINIPVGPYKFTGLPGLIVAIEDTKKEHVFQLIGFEKAKANYPIYNRTAGRITKMTKKDAFILYKNYCKNPMKMIKETGKFNLLEQDVQQAKPLPYNPIELEI